MLLRRRAVADDALAPRREHVAPRVAVTRRLEVPELQRARVERVGTGRALAPDGPHGVSTVVLIEMPSSMCSRPPCEYSNVPIA